MLSNHKVEFSLDVLSQSMNFIAEDWMEKDTPNNSVSVDNNPPTLPNDYPRVSTPSLNLLNVFLILCAGNKIKFYLQVYVWGLNDKDQLCGVKGSKVKVPVFSPVLSALRPVHIAGGSKTLFIVSHDGKVSY